MKIFEREKFKMLTPFGKRRGWELQKDFICRRRFWRLAWRDGGCRPATDCEIALWKTLPKDLTLQTEEPKR